MASLLRSHASDTLFISIHARRGLDYANYFKVSYRSVLVEPEFFARAVATMETELKKTMESVPEVDTVL